MAAIRRAVRVLLLDDDDRALLNRTVQPSTGRAFWFPPGGGIEAGEDARGRVYVVSLAGPVYRLAAAG